MSVTLINPFEVPRGKEKECLDMWKEAAEYLKKQPGFINTKLHQSIIDDAKFKYINVAEWKTPESFFRAIDTDEFKEITAGTMEAYPHYPSLYTVIVNI